MTVAATRETPDIPPHAPEAGRIRRFLGPFYVTGVFWFRLHRWGVRVLPHWSLRPLIALFATFFWLVLRNIRAAIGSNLEAVLGPCGWMERQRRIYRTLRTFSWCLSERYERLVTDRPFTAYLDGSEHLQALNAAGTGFLMVTAHLGAWEVGSTLATFDSPRRVHVVRESETDPRAQEFISELIRRRAGDLYTTHFAEDPQLGVHLLDALRRGEVVALQGDRPRCGGRTAEITLFGRPYLVPVGPMALARAAAVPILPVFVFREGRRDYRCALRPPIHVIDTGDRQADLDHALQRFAVELDWAIRHRPYQWFCFRKLWSRVEVGTDQAEQQLGLSPQSNLVNR
ncbi:MAG TPA: lysophospholipid acyltransferase family protein [Thermoanaerobaculia bacterium]|nr:lysophospholipid acyltransferase family protein [Thermoanaerobaculia bacterium]